MLSLIEVLRRAVKFVLFFGLAHGNLQIYMRLRASVMWWLHVLGLYERANLAMLTKLVSKNDICVDVGAHFGIYSRVLAKAVGPSGKVLAFEPLASVFEHLLGAVSKYPQVKCIKAALSDQAQQLTTIRMPLLFGKIPEPALASIAEETTAYLSEQVEQHRLDDYAAELKGLSFIKADVEGNEAKLLLGAKRVIAAEQPVIQFESNKREAAVKVMQAISETGVAYGLYVLDHGSLRKISGADEAPDKPTCLYLVSESKAL